MPHYKHGKGKRNKLAKVKKLPHLKDGNVVDNKALVRNWWHRIIQIHGRYSCFAIFLVLPADKAAISYLTEYCHELDAISGRHCLVLGLGQNQLQYFDFSQDAWINAVQEQVAGGHSVIVAELFNIDFTDFPCLVLFHDIRSPKHIAVNLKGMNTEEIAQQIRAIFSIVRKASVNKSDPLIAIELERGKEQFRKAGSSTISQIQAFAGKTIETIMEATVMAIIK